jgi:hypothetical protein
VETVFHITLSGVPSKEVLVALKLRTGKSLGEILKDILDSFMFEPIDRQLFSSVKRVMEAELESVDMPAVVSVVHNLSDPRSFCVDVDFTASACSSLPIGVQ